MPTQVKICGLTRPQDVSAAVKAGADYLGFIVEAKSSRRLSVTEAVNLVQNPSGDAQTVAVTVNPDDDLLARITTRMKPDYIQLHGDETPERAAEIRQTFKTKIIKAIPVSDPQDLDIIKDYDVDLILLDAKPPKGAARGGHGTSFDWAIVTDGQLPDMWALAGGITSDNALAAVKMTKAPILDVSSGVECEPGIKDPAKIKALMDTVKNGPTG